MKKGRWDNRFLHTHPLESVTSLFCHIALIPKVKLQQRVLSSPDFQHMFYQVQTSLHEIAMVLPHHIHIMESWQYVQSVRKFMRPPPNSAFVNNSNSDPIIFTGS